MDAETSELHRTLDLIVGLDELSTSLGAVLDEVPLPVIALLGRSLANEITSLQTFRSRYGGGRRLDAEIEVLRALHGQVTTRERELRRAARVARGGIDVTTDQKGASS